MSEHEAGRELDALVAEKVMGIIPRRIRVRGEVDTPPVTIYSNSAYWSNSDGHYERHYLQTYGAPRPYSTDIAAAWTVVEAMRERRIGEAEMRQVFSLAHCYPASEVATAICRAALAAVSAPVPQTQDEL